MISNGNAGGHPGRRVWKQVPMSELLEGDLFLLEGVELGDHLRGKPRLRCKAQGNAHELPGGTWGVNVEVLEP